MACSIHYTLRIFYNITYISKMMLVEVKCTQPEVSEFLFPPKPEIISLPVVEL